ncbi:MAG: ferritin family protein [Calditrichaceae bacterium]|nr:ferritin family protein [Calditrichia bacterium]NUQ42442.1 ferritin family protein [Calditrichaceae bacterium]
MIAEGLTALEALGLAVRCEMDARALYQNLASRIDNDLLKERFLNLAQEEKRQQLLLEKKHREMFPEVELEIPPCQLPREVLEKTPGKELTIQEVLKTALEEVRRAREFYLDCAETTGDLSGKRMFRFLADMKFSHQMMLTAELEMLEKYPAYYEGPGSWEVETRLKAPRIKR